jgi:hypothetical protein
MYAKPDSIWVADFLPQCFLQRNTEPPVTWHPLPIVAIGNSSHQENELSDW